MIPVCVPLIGKKEREYVLDCIDTNWIAQGSYIKKFESGFAKYCNCKYGISTTNGTSALHLALASLGIKEGDEVIIPAFTIVSCALAVLYCGAKPVLVDVERDTWNMNIEQIESKITSKTRAIMPVHIYGHPCDMTPILDIANEYNLFVVEDAAEAHGAEYKNQKVGGIGDIGCFSFYSNKLITTGEGGMIVTNDRKLAERARSLGDLAHSKKKRFLHCDFGFNYRMSNIQAAIGLAQLEKIDKLINYRRINAGLYNQYLGDIAGLTLPVEKSWARSIYWMYSILVEDKFGMNRDELMLELKKQGIETRTFFVPMHEQPALTKLGLFKETCPLIKFLRLPVSEDISRRGLYLPSGSSLKHEEIKYIYHTIKKISLR